MPRPSAGGAPSTSAGRSACFTRCRCCSVAQLRRASPQDVLQRSPLIGASANSPATVSSCWSLYFTLPALAGWVVKDWMPAILKRQFDIGQGHAGVSAMLYVQLASMVGAGLGGWLADRWMRRTRRGRIYVSAIGMSLFSAGAVRCRRRRHPRRRDRVSAPVRLGLGLLRLQQHADPVADRPAAIAGHRLRHHEPRQHQLRRTGRLGIWSAARSAGSAEYDFRRFRRGRAAFDYAGVVHPAESVAR